MNEIKINEKINGRCMGKNSTIIFFSNHKTERNSHEKCVKICMCFADLYDIKHGISVCQYFFSVLIIDRLLTQLGKAYSNFAPVTSSQRTTLGYLPCSVL